MTLITEKMKGIWTAAIIVLILGLIVFLVFLYFLRKYIKGSDFKNNIRCDGKVIIITGCNIGIGKETALELAARGAYIYMACRDKTKCEVAKEDIIKQTGNQNVFNRELDLASLESIRSFSKKFLEEQNRLDILINNAGIMAIPKMHTTDGFEMQLGVNHMGHFLLTNLLLDTLRASAPSRIVNVSSLAHVFGSIKKDDLNSDQSYNKFMAYSQSKLANILFSRELAKRVEGTDVTVYSVHPGVVKTELVRYIIGPCLQRLIDPVLSFFLKTPKSGAQTTLACALDPVLAKVTGKYFADCKVVNEWANARDDDMAKWLWEESEKWTFGSRSNLVFP